MQPCIWYLQTHYFSLHVTALCLFRPDDINAQSLESIQRSVALICLDQPNPDIRAAQDNTLLTHNAMTATCARGLHGNGVTRNSENRWFDKPMQVLL